MKQTEIRVGELTITVNVHEAIPENTAYVFQPLVIRDRLRKGELSSITSIHKRYEQKLIEAIRWFWRRFGDIEISAFLVVRGARIIFAWQHPIISVNSPSPTLHQIVARAIRCDKLIRVTDLK